MSNSIHSQSSEGVLTPCSTEETDVTVLDVVVTLEVEDYG